MPGTNTPVQSVDGAEQLTVAQQAALLLRSKNIKEYKSILTCAGLLNFPNGVGIQSGINVMFVNKGLFNGKWIIQKEVLHITESKFVSEIEFRKCIDPAPTGVVTKTVENSTPIVVNPDEPVS